ncbi:MAG TPA: hypothetical protein VK581_13160 [Chthoniobacterales bacterium]|nr:hypothetical protein [Chthoniobacterales bacterium]
MVSLFIIFFLLLLLTIAVGATLLWARTKRLPALIQVIACSVVFLMLASKQVAIHLRAAGMPAFYDFTGEPIIERITEITLPICFIAFSVGYFWHALTQRRI